MNSTDSTMIPATARGDVVLSLVDPTGRVKIPFVARHNTLSYAAAGAVAAAYGGDTSLVPRYIGFVYGENPNPIGLAEPSNRDMTWDKIRSEMSEDNVCGNILVSRFIMAPELSTRPASGSNDMAEEGKYLKNAVTFRAVTRSGAAGEYAFDTSADSKFAGEFSDGKYLYHALLLGEVPCQRCADSKIYTPLARVSLMKGGSFRKKPSSYELALDWTVSFF